MKRYLDSLLLLFLTVFIITACENQIEKPLRIGTNTWAGYEPLYLSRDLGFYKNTQVNLVELPSASEVIHALRSDNLEGATLTLDEALTLVEDDFDLKVILVMDYSDGADVLIVKPEITSLKELAGKKIAVETTAVGAILLDGALEKAGLDVHQVELVGCPIDKHEECFKTVDALVTFEPARTRILNEGGVEIYNSSEIPGRIVDVLVVKESVIASHQNSIRQLVHGYFKARNYLSENPQQASEKMAVRLSITPDEVLESFKGMVMPDQNQNKRLLSTDDHSLSQIAAQLNDLMISKGLMNEKVEVRDLADGQFLP